MGFFSSKLVDKFKSLYTNKLESSHEEIMNKLVAVDEHLAFVEDLTKKYNSTDIKCDWGNIYSTIEKIKEKKKDKKLNLSIIGEFSTGKSTFINAILGKELLASSALQGTTVASTIIEYGSKHQLKIEYLDNKQSKVEEFSTFDQLQLKLQEYTTNGAIACQLKSVRVLLPLDILKNDFRIIDTPGTNVTEAWHEDVTIRTIKDEADLSIVLLSAEKQLTMTCTAFVKRYLSGILPQCIFVVTKIDLIRPRERSRVLGYIKGKIEEEFELAQAVVIPFSSTLLLDSQESYSLSETISINENDYSDEALLPLTKLGIKKIVDHTNKQKNTAIAKKLISLIDESHGLLSSNMEVIEAACQERMALLEKSKTPKLETFVNNKRVLRLQSFDNKINKILDDFNEDAVDAAETGIGTIYKQLDRCDSIGAMKDYVNNYLAYDCYTATNNMLNHWRSREKYPATIVKYELEEFNKDFYEAYDSLQIAPVKLSQGSLQFPTSVNINAANLNSIKEYIKEELSNEDGSFIGGAAAGAALGTMLFPGVGTLLGGAVGFLLGAAGAPDINEVRQNCKKKLHNILVNYYNEELDVIWQAAVAYCGTLKNVFNDEMKGYVARYYSEINRKLEEESRLRTKLMSQSNNLAQDKQVMDQHKEMLQIALENLNNSANGL